MFFRDTVVISGYVIYSGYTWAISPNRGKGLLITTVLAEPGQPAVFSSCVRQGALPSWGERFRDNACWGIWRWKANKKHFAKDLRGGRGAAEEGVTGRLCLSPDRRLSSRPSQDWRCSCRGNRLLSFNLTSRLSLKFHSKAKFSLLLFCH